MSTTDPRRLGDVPDLLAALHASMGGRTTDLPSVRSAVLCAYEHPITGLLCNRLRDDCDGNHSPDGVDPWTPNPNTKD